MLILTLSLVERDARASGRCSQLIKHVTAGLCCHCDGRYGRVAVVVRSVATSAAAAAACAAAAAAAAHRGRPHRRRRHRSSAAGVGRDKDESQIRTSQARKAALQLLYGGMCCSTGTQSMSAGFTVRSNLSGPGQSCLKEEITTRTIMGDDLTACLNENLCNGRTHARRSCARPTAAFCTQTRRDGPHDNAATND